MVDLADFAIPQPALNPSPASLEGVPQQVRSAQLVGDAVPRPGGPGFDSRRGHSAPPPLAGLCDNLQNRLVFPLFFHMCATPGFEACGCSRSQHSLTSKCMGLFPGADFRAHIRSRAKGRNAARAAVNEGASCAFPTKWAAAASWHPPPRPAAWHTKKYCPPLCTAPTEPCDLRKPQGRLQPWPTSDCVRRRRITAGYSPGDGRTCTSSVA